MTLQNTTLAKHLRYLGCKESPRSNETWLILLRAGGDCYFIHRATDRVLIGTTKKDVQQIPQQRINKFIQFMEQHNEVARRGN